MRLFAGLCATLALVSCADSPPHAKGVGGLVSPTPIIGAQLSPLTLPFNALRSPFCPLAPSFTTAFDLIVDAGLSARVSLDRVTLHLNDGTNVGSSLTFPSAELNRMFGSTVIAGSRRFGFRPTFGCGAVLPRSILAELDLRDAGGAIRTVTVSGRFE